jgi:hypothetical protein
MFRRFSFIVYLALAFLALSGIVYFVHFVIFRDVHHIFIYMVGDLAFLPLEVLLVVLIIERVLARREKQAKLQKLNMVVGAFFTEVGNHLLGSMLKYFGNHAEISERMSVNADWDRKDFRRAADYAYHLDIKLDTRDVNLAELRSSSPRSAASF